MLDAAAWYTDAFQTQFESLLLDMYHRIAARSGQPIPAIALISKSRAIHHNLASIAQDVERDLHRRWESLFDLTNQPTAYYRTEELRSDVNRLFPCPQHTQSLVRHQSPDIMIAANSAHDLVQGNLQFVLGETHAGLNTIMMPPFLATHPHQNQLVDYFRQETSSRDRISLVCGRQVASRLVARSGEPMGVQWIMGDVPSRYPDGCVFPISEIVVVSTDQGLMAQTRDGRHQWNLLTALSQYYRHLMAIHFSLFGPKAYQPRIAVDDLIIARRKWRMPCSEIPFGSIKDRNERILIAHRWQHELDMPRWVFVKVSFEQKPWFVDFHSSISVDALAKLLRRGTKEKAVINLTEMLPTPQQCWLTDAEGNRYTSELRIATLPPLP